MMLIVAFLSRAHPNWSAPTYESSAILATGFLLRARRRGLLALSFALGLLAATYAYAYPPPSWTKAHGVELPSWTDPWNRLRGWRELGDKVGALLATRPGVTLMGEDRETLAALAYYVHPHPPDMVKWNPSRRIADHFALTTDAERRRGGDFLFVSESEDVSSTLPFFADVREVAALRIPRGGGRFRSYWVFEMRGFKGYRP
jgi:hypothetical protein